MYCNLHLILSSPGYARCHVASATVACGTSKYHHKLRNRVSYSATASTKVIYLHEPHGIERLRRESISSPLSPNLYTRKQPVIVRSSNARRACVNAAAVAATCHEHNMSAKLDASGRGGGGCGGEILARIYTGGRQDLTTVLIVQKQAVTPPSFVQQLF